VMGIDATCSDDSMVNGKQVLSLLPSVRLGAVEAFLCLLIKFLKQELKNMPRGVISSAVRKAKKSSGYKGLDDILTALRNTSLPGLPSGEYLMCVSIHFFKLNGTRLLIALSLAELHTCFLLLLSLARAAMCFITAFSNVHPQGCSCLFYNNSISHPVTAGERNK